MATISKKAGLKHIYTNHCIRATTVTRLRDAGIAPTDIINVTGHRSVQSLEHYSKPSGDVRKLMSNTLSSVCNLNAKRNLLSCQKATVVSQQQTTSGCAIQDESRSVLPLALPSISSSGTKKQECSTYVPSDCNLQSDLVKVTSHESHTASMTSQTLAISMNPRAPDAFITGQAFNNCQIHIHYHHNSESKP